jgi:hypothetical protein
MPPPFTRRPPRQRPPGARTGCSNNLRRRRWRRSRAIGRSPSWRASSGFIRTRSTTGRSSCWTGRRAFSRAAPPRARVRSARPRLIFSTGRLAS